MGKAKELAELANNLTVSGGAVTVSGFNYDNIVDSAPGALNTLNELAAAIGDDASFSTTVTNSIATKAPLADPNFTGNVDIQTTAGKLTVEALGSGSVKLKSDGSLGFNVPTGYNYEIDVNDQEVFRINQSGNVGIGSSSPAYVVDAVGTTGNTAYLRVTRATASQGEVGVWLNDWAMYQKTNSANLHWYRAVTGDLLTLTTTGRVGIGSTDPGSTFDVRNGTANTQVASFSGADSGGGLKIKTASTTRNDDTVIFNASDAFGEIAFASDNTEVMRISDSYKVGIGTNDPQQMLHIRGASPQIMLEDSDASGTPYSKLSGVDGNLFFQADEGNEAASSFISMRVDGSEKLKLTDTTIRVGGGGCADSVNTQFNMEFPATGGLSFGSAYTFSNIYGDAGGNLFLKANAYPANTGSATKVEFRAANSGGGMSRELCWYNNGSLGIGVSAPEYSVDIEGANFQDSSIRLKRTDAGANNDSGIYFVNNQTAANGGLGGLWFTNSYQSGNAYAMIRARTQETTSSGKLQFITSNGVVGNTTPAKMTINHAGDILYGGQFNFHVISGFSAPNSAFQYDFYRGTYGTPIKVTAAITHWNSSYMSYTEGMYWGFNTAMTSNVFHSYNGGNGSWTISFPTNNIIRVRMNGDASYNYASGWYIKVEGNLRREYTSS